MKRKKACKKEQRRVSWRRSLDSVTSGVAKEAQVLASGGKKIKEVMTEKMKAVWEINESAEEEKEEVVVNQDYPLRFTLIPKLKKLQE